MTEPDYFASLPASQQMEMRRLAWKYLRRPDIPDVETAQELLAWSQLEKDVLEAHSNWLAATRAAVEGQGRDWTVDEMNLYIEETEHQP